MAWTVRLHDEFEDEVRNLPPAVRVALLAHARLLAIEGPTLGRPYADTLAGSRHRNMKELRFAAGDGAWRVAFAFDPERAAILLVAGDKSGVSQRRFYRTLIAVADRRFDEYLKGVGHGTHA
ncbi:MAG TPA: type II toxin-antitoxin system RelE/ParE family toxin [Azospirillaceae bacterium]|nr:type II toxin-antitoxin system RelE/ParE family toxin [Azospirillaceae bacterium]